MFVKAWSDKTKSMEVFGAAAGQGYGKKLMYVLYYKVVFEVSP